MRLRALTSRAISGALLALVAATSVACGAVVSQSTTPTPAVEKAGIANPASVNCVEKGGKLNIVQNPTGEVGMYTLPDGTVCEEWALLRGECKPGDKR